jgi:hypothetical protein
MVAHNLVVILLCYGFQGASGTRGDVFVACDVSIIVLVVAVVKDMFWLLWG